MCVSFVKFSWQLGSIDVLGPYHARKGYPFSSAELNFEVYFHRNVHPLPEQASPQSLSPTS